MAFVDVLIAAWNNPTQPPPGVIGLPLTGQTTTVKLARVNAWTVATPQKAVVKVTDVFNCIVLADYKALTSLQLQQLLLAIGGGQTVDGSPGTLVRALFQDVFAGKATTLANLTALVSPYDNATTNWVQFNGGPVPIGPAELIGTGLS